MPVNYICDGPRGVRGHPSQGRERVERKPTPFPSTKKSEEEDPLFLSLDNAVRVIKESSFYICDRHDKKKEDK